MSSISVIIPAYNAEKYIGEAIESALNQTCPPRKSSWRTVSGGEQPFDRLRAGQRTSAFAKGFRLRRATADKTADKDDGALVICG